MSNNVILIDIRVSAYFSIIILLILKLFLIGTLHIFSCGHSSILESENKYIYFFIYQAILTKLFTNSLISIVSRTLRLQNLNSGFKKASH